jgi:hypothetical protein
VFQDHHWFVPGHHAPVASVSYGSLVWPATRSFEDPGTA